jgi:hypothetical protein
MSEKMPKLPDNNHGNQKKTIMLQVITNHLPKRKMPLLTIATMINPKNLLSPTLLTKKIPPKKNRLSNKPNLS